MKEYEIVEKLFLPPEIKASRDTEDAVMKEEAPSRRGTRTSSRQRAKQDNAILLEREKEIARRRAGKLEDRVYCIVPRRGPNKRWSRFSHTEKQRIKRLLKEAQQSLMLWDPRSDARKPPKNSVQLLLSVRNVFDLATSFIECTSPDYIIDTIGSTNRDSIERAYDWLIPVISSFPSVITRLPSSASCFLLLRAYGKEGDGTSELLKLSSPLLTHVQKSLLGDHGAEGAKRAADLLFFDIADKDSDRRHCARRVLLEALGKVEVSKSDYPCALHGDFRWLVGLLETKYSDLIATSAIPRLTSALFLERGDVLHAYTHALHYYDQSGVTGENTTTFSSTLFGLLSSKPHICCAAMDRHSDLTDLMIRAVYNAFNSMDEPPQNGDRVEDIVMNMRRVDDDMASEVHISSSLLQASIVLISNWRDDVESTAKTEFMSLTTCLLQSKGHLGRSEGAASARYTDSEKRVVSVEEVR